MSVGPVGVEPTDATTSPTNDLLDSPLSSGADSGAVGAERGSSTPSPAIADLLSALASLTPEQRAALTALIASTPTNSTPTKKREEGATP